jgi:1-deoxy-D-xylulose-5-phosphate reductoisomerase
VLNAANEECVAAFLGGRLPFLGIVDVVARVVGEHSPLTGSGMTVDDVLAAEDWARERARELVGV